MRFKVGDIYVSGWKELVIWSTDESIKYTKYYGRRKVRGEVDNTKEDRGLLSRYIKTCGFELIGNIVIGKSKESISSEEAPKAENIL